MTLNLNKSKIYINMINTVIGFKTIIISLIFLTIINCNNAKINVSSLGTQSNGVKLKNSDYIIDDLTQVSYTGICSKDTISISYRLDEEKEWTKITPLVGNIECESKQTFDLNLNLNLDYIKTLPSFAQNFLNIGPKFNIYIRGETTKYYSDEAILIVYQTKNFPVAFTNEVSAFMATDSLKFTIDPNFTKASTYLYKFGEVTTLNCSDPLGYQVEPLDVSTNPNIIFTTAKDGMFGLCIIGQKNKNTIISYDFADKITWAKDSSPPLKANQLTWNTTSPTKENMVSISWNNSTGEQKNLDLKSQVIYLYSDASCFTQAKEPIIIDTPNISSYLFDGSLLDGTIYTFKITLNDNFSNSAESDCSAPLIIDRKPPQISSTNPSVTFVNTLNSSVSVNYNEVLSASSIPDLSKFSLICNNQDLNTSTDHPITSIVSIVVPSSNQQPSFTQLIISFNNPNFVEGENCNLTIVNDGIEDIAKNKVPVGTVFAKSWSITGNPTVVSISSITNSGSYKFGSSIYFKIIFSKSVNVSNSFQLKLNIDSNSYATCNAGTNLTEINCSYSISSSDNILRLDYSDVNAIKLGASTIIGKANSLPAYITLPDTQSSSDGLFAANISLDNTVPILSGLTNSSTPVKSKSWEWFCYDNVDTSCQVEYYIDNNPTGSNAFVAAPSVTVGTVTSGTVFQNSGN